MHSGASAALPRRSSSSSVELPTSTGAGRGARRHRVRRLLDVDARAQALDVHVVGVADLGRTLLRREDAQLGALLVGQVVEREAAEEVVEHAGGDAQVGVVGHARGLEAQVGELRDVELERDAVLEAHGDRHREGVHHAGQRGALLAELDEDLAEPVVGVGARGEVALGAADGERDGLARPLLGQPPPHRARLDRRRPSPRPPWPTCPPRAAGRPCSCRGRSRAP